MAKLLFILLFLTLGCEIPVSILVFNYYTSPKFVDVGYRAPDEEITKIREIPDSLSHLFAIPMEREKFQHIEIIDIYFSKKRNKYMANSYNADGDIVFNVTVNDTISEGEIIKIGDSYIEFKNKYDRVIIYHIDNDK